MELKCEKCGGAIQYGDCLDMEHGGDYDDTIICTYDGYCHKCKTEYTWIEEYKYHHRRNLEIIKN